MLISTDSRMVYQVQSDLFRRRQLQSQVESYHEDSRKVSVRNK
jgi:hypothetical protein